MVPVHEIQAFIDASQSLTEVGATPLPLGLVATAVTLLVLTAARMPSMRKRLLAALVGAALGVAAFFAVPELASIPGIALRIPPIPVAPTLLAGWGLLCLAGARWLHRHPEATRRPSSHKTTTHAW